MISPLISQPLPLTGAVFAGHHDSKTPLSQ
jgi:hypothetical protein